MEVAQYARDARIDKELAFAWWVPYTIKKRDRLIRKVKAKYWTSTHNKYGVRIPKNIEEAKRIDAENGNMLWMDAVRLEMKNIMVAFVEYHGNDKDLLGYEVITGDLVFDVKLGEKIR